MLFSSWCHHTSTSCAILLPLPPPPPQAPGTISTTQEADGETVQSSASDFANEAASLLETSPSEVPPPSEAVPCTKLDTLEGMAPVLTASKDAEPPVEMRSSREGFRADRLRCTWSSRGQSSASDVAGRVLHLMTRNHGRKLLH